MGRRVVHVCLFTLSIKSLFPFAKSLSVSFGYMLILLPIQFGLLRFSSNFTSLLWPQWLIGCGHMTRAWSNVDIVRKDVSLSAVVKWELPVSCLLPVGGSLSTKGNQAKTENQGSERTRLRGGDTCIHNTLTCTYTRHNTDFLDPADLRLAYPLCLSVISSGISSIHTPKL